MEKNSTKVLILGGGSAGSIIALKLEKAGIDFILVDNKEVFETTPLAIPTLVDKTHSDKIRVEHSRYIKKGKFVLGKVTKVTKDNVELEDGTSISFEFLIIATGASYRSPFTHSNVIVAYDSKTLASHYDAVSAAKSILIVGGGIVGAEVAAELASAHGKDKLITLVSSTSTILPTLPPKAQVGVTNHLLSLRVKIIAGEKVTESADATHYKTDKGTSIEADVVVYAGGTVPNSELMKANFSEVLNEKNQIKVDEYFRVEGHTNIFAVGDVTAIPQEKRASFADEHGQLLANNLVSFFKKPNKKLKAYKVAPKPSATIVLLGPKSAMVMGSSYFGIGKLSHKMKFSVILGMVKERQK